MNNGAIEYSSYFSKKISFINVVMTIFIVLLHAKTPERFGLPLDISNSFIYCMTVLCQIAVPMFFFVSGLLFYRGCAFKDIERKLHSRIYTLLIPYIVWNVFFVGIFFIMSRIPIIHDKMKMGDVLNSPREIVEAIVTARYTVLWFVKNLMVYCLLSAGIFLALTNKISAFVVLVVSIIFVLIGDFGYESIYRWFPNYFSGAIVGRFYSGYKNEYNFPLEYVLNTRSKRILITALMFVIFLLLFIMTVREDKSISEKNSLFVYSLCTPIILWFLVDLLLKKILCKKFQVKTWMSYTFFIFCTHQFILNVLQKIVVLFCPSTTFVLNATYIVTTIVTILFLIYIAKFLSRYKFYKYLSGGR